MYKKRLIAASYGHLSIDILNASVAMILTLVSGRFNLSIAQIGFGAMIYQITAAMSQPLFGGLTDRLHGRWVGPLGLMWTMIFFSLASFMPTYPLFMITLTIGGLGSGALHAAGMVNAALSGGAKPTTSTSIFFLGGQTGLAIGPILTGILAPRLGMMAMPLMALAMTPALIMMFVYMNSPLPQAPKRTLEVSSPSRAGSLVHAATAVAVTAFVIFITLRAGTHQSYATLLPKYFDSLGYSPAVFGLMLGVFNFAGALGTLLGGFLGDRYNRRLIMAFSTMLSAPFAYMMLYSQGAAYVVTAVVASLLLSIPHSILLIMAQELAPARRGFMGGLTLGFMFASGSTVAWIVASLADTYGLVTMLSLVAFFPLIAGFFAFLLPSTRRPSPGVTTVPATATASGD